MLLSTRGYTVVSMTRALVQLSRLSRALRPRAILVDLESEGAAEVVRELRDHDDRAPLLVFARDDLDPVSGAGAMSHASDTALVEFVLQRG